MDIEIKQFKYICNTCYFRTDTKARWNAHINTGLHKNGKRKARSDIKEPQKCEYCGYTTKNKTTLKKHILNKHKNKEDRQKEFNFYCVGCDFGTFSKDSFETHCNSEKHKHYLYILNDK